MNAVRAGSTVLYRAHLDGVAGPMGGPIGTAFSWERVGLSASDLFEHSGERVTFTFEPSIGTTPGGGGGGGGGGGIGLDGFGGGFGGDSLGGFPGGGEEDPPGGGDPPPPPDPTTWVIERFATTPMISTVELGGGAQRSEAPISGGETAPIIFSFGRTGGALLEYPLEIEYDLWLPGEYRASLGSDFRVDPDHFIDVDEDGQNDNIGLASSLIFPAGKQSGAVVLRPLDDEDLEPNESVPIRLKPGGNDYRVGRADGTSTAQMQRDGVVAEGKILDDEVRIYLFAGNGGSGGATQDTNGIDGVDEHDINSSQGIWTLRQMLLEDPRLDDSEVRAFTSEVGSVFAGSRDNAENYVIRSIERAINTVKNRALGMAMAGYSWGGGMLADITRRLPNRRGIGAYVLTTTAYIDAIDHRSVDWLRMFNDFIAPAEQTGPVGTQRHLNFYQSMDDPNDAPGEGEDKSNYPNGAWSGGFISVNMDVNAAVRSSPNVDRSLFANKRASDGPIEAGVGDPVLADPPQPDNNNLFTHTNIDDQEPILFELVEWFVADLL